MKRAVALFTMIFALMLGAALAEPLGGVDTPVNPYFNDAQIRDPMIQSNAASDLKVKSMRNNTSDAFGRDTKWTITVTKTADEEAVDVTDRCLYRFYLANLYDPEAGLTASNLNVNGYQNWSTDNTFTYRFVVADAFVMRVDVYDCGDEDPAAVSASSISASAVKSSYYRLPVEFTNVEGVPTVEGVVTSLENECEAACDSDFERAVWLHDWLTHHAYYDYSYSYYSADAILVRGTGVCDGYSKAYQMLLDAVGIDSARVVGGNHAWNRVAIEGTWTMIDPTWDDSGTESVPVSGNERHLYFGLTDDLLSVNHTYASDGSCTSLEANYFVRTGFSDAWVESVWDGVRASLDAGTIEQNALSFPSRYLNEAGSLSATSAYIPRTITAWVLNQMARDSILYDGQTYDVDYSVTQEDVTSTATLDWALVFDAVLELPAGTTTIEDEAFAGDEAVMAVILPEGVETIGDRAFADCPRLWRVYIQSPIDGASDTAFENSPHAQVELSE